MDDRLRALWNSGLGSQVKATITMLDAIGEPPDITGWRKLPEDYNFQLTRGLQTPHDNLVVRMARMIEKGVLSWNEESKTFLIHFDHIATIPPMATAPGTSSNKPPKDAIKKRPPNRHNNRHLPPRTNEEKQGVDTTRIRLFGGGK